MVERVGQGRAQHVIHLAPCGQRLRQVACGQHRAVLREGHARLHFHADGVVECDAGGCERVEQFRVRNDARAATGEFIGNALVDFDIPAIAHQQVRGEETAQRSADDDRLLCVSGRLIHGQAPVGCGTFRIKTADFVGREVEFDGDAGRVFDEYLMQAETRHRAIPVSDALRLQRLPHRFDAGGEKCNVIDDTRSGRGRLLLAEVGGEAGGVVRIDADDVHGAEVGFVAALVEPCAGKIERRAIASPEAKNPFVEAARFFEIGRANRVVSKL